MANWNRGSQIHGTWSSYNHHGCRCRACRDANARHQRERRQRKGIQPRGARTTFLDVSDAIDDIAAVLIGAG